MKTDEVDRTVELMARLEPMLERFVKRINKEGPNVSVSIMAMVVTNLMVEMVIKIEEHGGDIDDFIKFLMIEAKHKYDVESVKSYTESALAKMMLHGLDPDGTVH